MSKILVVEDNELNVDMLERRLKKGVTKSLSQLTDPSMR